MKGIESQFPKETWQPQRGCTKQHSFKMCEETKPELKGEEDKPTSTDGHFNTIPQQWGERLDRNRPGCRGTQQHLPTGADQHVWNFPPNTGKIPILFKCPGIYTKISHILYLQIYLSTFKALKLHRVFSLTTVESN